MVRGPGDGMGGLVYTAGLPHPLFFRGPPGWSTSVPRVLPWVLPSQELGV